MLNAPLLRAMTASEVKQLVGWAADEGWNPGLDDPSTFYAIDPDGFIAVFWTAQLHPADGAATLDPAAMAA